MSIYEYVSRFMTGSSLAWKGEDNITARFTTYYHGPLSWHILIYSYTLIYKLIYAHIYSYLLIYAHIYSYILI